MYVNVDKISSSDLKKLKIVIEAPADEENRSINSDSETCFGSLWTTELQYISKQRFGWNATTKLNIQRIQYNETFIIRHRLDMYSPFMQMCDLYKFYKFIKTG